MTNEQQSYIYGLNVIITIITLIMFCFYTSKQNHKETSEDLYGACVAIIFIGFLFGSILLIAFLGILLFRLPIKIMKHFRKI